jgi:hypothetical protein
LITQALDPSEGLVVVPFAEEWQSYFPDGSPLRFPKWPFPNPDTTEFLRGYGEPLWLIVEAAVELRRTLSVIAYYKSKRREPNESQRQSIRSALSGLTALAGPESLDVDESGSVKADSHPLSSSLLQAYVAMIMRDLLGGDPVRLCGGVTARRRMRGALDRCLLGAEVRGRS